MKKLHAFTLVEILTVVIILGVIAGLAVPKYFSTVENINAKNAQKLLVEIYGAQKRYHIQTSTYADDLDDLDISLHADAAFDVPTIDTGYGNYGNYQISLTRRAGSPPYTLHIDQDATITCTGNICTRLGF